MPLPRLIVVTGRPGVGKTTLAHALAREIRCPAICRDEIKEGLLNTEGTDLVASPEIARRAFDAFFDALTFLIDRKVTLVAEAAFQHARWSLGLQPILPKADVRLIVCHVDPAVALARRRERDAHDSERALYHQDPFPTAPEPYEPPRLDRPALAVDTTHGYDPSFEAIVEFVREEGTRKEGTGKR